MMSLFWDPINKVHAGLAWVQTSSYKAWWTEDLYTEASWPQCIINTISEIFFLPSLSYKFLNASLYIAFFGAILKVDMQRFVAWLKNGCEGRYHFHFYSQILSMFYYHNMPTSAFRQQTCLPFTLHLITTSWKRTCSGLYTDIQCDTDLETPQEICRNILTRN